MGQELLNRGVKPVSNLWSASALVDPQYHKIVVETHLDFINAGSEMILTNTFGSRKRRIIENKMIDRFAEINITAGKLAKEAVIRSGKKVLIGGSLPPQNFTYISDLGSDLNFIRKSFEEQANFILPYIDFSTQTPNLEQILISTSDPKIHFRSYFDLNFICFSTVSFEIPITIVFKSSNSLIKLLNDIASFVHPVVSAFGKKNKTKFLPA